MNFISLINPTDFDDNLKMIGLVIVVGFVLLCILSNILNDK